MAAKVTKLVVCDFDSTLFNSPYPPEMVRWSDRLTLEIDSFANGQADVESNFNKEVLRAMQEYQSDPTVYAVLLTGRPEGLKDLVDKIIGGRVRFKEEHFASGYTETEVFKKSVISNLLKKLPDVKEVEIWEDRPPHRAAFKEFVEQKGFKATLGSFTPATQENSVQFNKEVLAELHVRLEKLKKRKQKEEEDAARKRDQPVVIGFVIVPENEDTKDGLDFSKYQIISADGSEAKQAKGRYVKDPVLHDLKFITVSLPPSESLESFKSRKIPDKYLDVFSKSTQKKKKPEAA
jgi:hypothetical protein